MKTQNRNRARRFGLLPTMLLATLGIAIASVGHAETPPRIALDHGTEPATKAPGSLREEMQAMAEEAAWKTRVSVAKDLSARLNRQHRPYRVASLGVAIPRG
jgi:Flp pilus assembly protein TadD